MTKLNKSMEFDVGGGEASGSEDSDEDLLEQFTGSEFYTAGKCTIVCVSDFVHVSVITVCMCGYGEHVGSRAATTWLNFISYIMS